MSEGVLVALLIAVVVMQHWLAIVAALALYLWCGVRYMRRAKVKPEPYSIKDWAFGLSLWWLFALSDLLKRIDRD